MKVYRQGDVVAIKVESKEAGQAVKRDNGRVVLAYGEISGHCHAILDKSAVMTETKEGKRFLDAPDGATLTHEEHGTVILPSGVYEIKRQQEYTPEEIRNVAD